ncbi:hypothetical protein MTO96_024609 [Rhipicephalus appendiculatus]
MARGLLPLFLFCCALVALTLVNVASARVTARGAAESARIEFEHTPTDAEWEAMKAQMRYWQQLADQEPA